MKKLLLSLAVMAFGFSVTNAEEITIFSAENQAELKWNSETDGYSTEVTVNNQTFKIETHKGSYNSNLIQPTDQIRVYKGSTITVSSETFEFKSIVLTSSGGNYGNEQTVSEGWTQKYDATSKTLTITSETASKSMTMTASANQFRVTNIVLNSEIAAEPEPVERPTVNSIAETLKLDSKTDFTVGYALTVGYVNNSNIFVCDAAGDFIQLYGSNKLKPGDVIPAGWDATYELYNGVTPELTSFTLPASTEGTFEAKTVSATSITNALVNSVVKIENVEFAEKTGANKTNFEGKVGEATLSFRNNYNVEVVDAGTYNVTVVVTLYKAEGASEYTPSLYVTEYEKIGGETPEPVEPEIVKVANLKEAFALESGTEVVVDCALTVGFVNGNNILVRDEAGDFIQIYKSNKLKIGDVIPAGWEATYTLRYDVPQFAPKADLPEATEGTFTPAVVAAADVTKALVNHVIVVKDVVLDEATPDKDETDNNKKNFTGKVGDITLNLRNNYKLESVPAGTYDIECWVNLYNGETSLYVIKFEKSATDGISEIEAEDAEAVYYNLQGVEVANPANGVYIVRRGAKVTKEFIR